jgi:hypothetical protein
VRPALRSPSVFNTAFLLAAVGKVGTCSTLSDWLSPATIGISGVSGGVAYVLAVTFVTASSGERTQAMREHQAAIEQYFNNDNCSQGLDKHKKPFIHIKQQKQ